eukprot:TRINITY_DN10311_c0_g1_i1.p1 TRINITY_DN10311_c0_g1~~TRINITY_DN10311_c0_g1_i1.p1  ORF type:complete len:256 (-),score=62.25 TRINITY_DN10311_c0_g1_i1:125-841(-)
MNNNSSKKLNLGFLWWGCLSLLLLASVLPLAISEEVENSVVVELDDSNFEALTQASTGATTGDWFIEFYAPWCGYCKRLAPVWEDLAKELQGKIVVAKVDADKNSGLRNRFEIKGFPTLKFFRQGVYYNYTGDRSLASLVSFAEGGYQSVKETRVPKMPTAVDEMSAVAAKFLESLEKDLMHIYDLRKAAAGLLVLFGFLLGLAVAFICCAIVPLPPPPPPSTARRVADSQSTDKKSK